MDKVDISIIMPVYNGEKYLGETLENLLKQTHKNFEVVCINDASTDTTLNILRKFQKSDRRIRILENRERVGAASSRNRGIKEATGKYITFLDGDDIFEEEMLEIAYETIVTHDADIVIYELVSVQSEYIYQKKERWRSDSFIKKYCMTPFSIHKCEPDELIDWGSSPCNKLYRKEFIKEKELQFQTLSSANDVYFVNMALLLAEKLIMVADRRIMVYAREHNEITRISHDRDPMCTYRAMLKLGQELVNRGLFSEMFQSYYCLVFYIFRFALMNTKREEIARRFYDFLQREGINKLVSFDYFCYERLDIYLHDSLEKYRQLDFDTRWYKTETRFAYRLHRNAQKVVSVFERYNADDEPIALWGAGVNGGILLRFLREHGLKVSEVVDKDKEKQGVVLEGYMIREPREIIKEIQIVFVCTFSVYQEVVTELGGIGIKMINIEEILQEDE